jgi:hypothetical protein
MSKPIIYCFCNLPMWTELGGPVVALAEDGTLLASHYSSNESFAQMDIGVLPYMPGVPPAGAGNTARYDAHYPDGYELVWIENAGEDERVLRAAELNRQQAIAAGGGGSGVFVPDPHGNDGQRELTVAEARERGL